MRLSWLGLASIILAVAIFPSMFTAYGEFYVKPLLEKYPPALRPIIDYEPFFSTWYGIITISVWILLAIS
ncbi:hypothetical protein DRO54_08680 [Candidatus Bathyarchaeota archaeon]|nr:MAG: hypothetical protein DRO54_08680 [Candidatus Bathyarchaeota archaeon]